MKGSVPNPSQEARVLAHMRQHGSITTIEAVNMHILRLSERIARLKKRGNAITKEIVRGTRWARYTLIES